MSKAKEVHRELNRREWDKRIAECESSNMSVREWCDANGINVNTYYGRVSALKNVKEPLSNPNSKLFQIRYTFIECHSPSCRRMALYRPELKIT